jgi:t-SNARE complex subunit (syntaxin)
MQASYMQMKKISNEIKNSYDKIVKEDYTDKNWERDGRTVTNTINTYKKLYDDLSNKVNYVKENSLVKNEGTVSKVEEALESAKKTTLQYIQAINEKTRYYNNDFEMNSPSVEEPAPAQQEVVMDLMNNREVLEKRRKELESIHKTAAILKDTTDQMAQDLNKQGAQLEEIEANVITSKENAEKAHKEIVKADELSRGNRKRMLCLIFAVFIAIGGITAILLSLFL